MSDLSNAELVRRAKHRREIQIVRAAASMLHLRVVGGSSYYAAVAAALMHNTRTLDGGLLYHETRSYHNEKAGTLYLIFDPSKTSDDFMAALSWASVKLHGTQVETVIVLWSGEPHTSVADYRKRQAELRRNTGV